MISEYLKKKRTGAGVTQRALASHLGYTSAQYVSNVERGLCNPPLGKLKAYCKFINADLNKCKKFLQDDLMKRIG